MSADCAQAQTVENALTGEKAFRRIEFAVTGQPDADLISGIHSLFREFPQANARARHRILEYLAARYRDQAELEEFWAKNNSTSPPWQTSAVPGGWTGQQTSPILGGVMSTPPSALPYPPYTAVQTTAGMFQGPQCTPVPMPHDWEKKHSEELRRIMRESTK